MREKKEKLICKKCGNETYFYTKDYVFGKTISIYNFDRKMDETGMNSEMYAHLDYKRTSKFFFCYECDRKVEKIKENH